MESNNYGWQRFWCLSEDNLRLDNEGFLPDPENDYERYYNPNLVTLDDISHIPCLILLGEAGIGKTTTMKTEYEKLKAQIEQSEDTCLWFDLRYSANNSSSNYVFNQHIFKIWENGTHKLHLFLDSLDEGLLALNTIDLILEQEIDQLFCDRLYLRITCRTTDWSNILTEKFQEKWGKNNTKIYHLCPLRRKDVIEALNKRQIEIEPFFQELFLKEIVPFATQPITFKLLLDIYKENYQFPNSKKDLYFEGCLMLCKEIHNKYRLKPKFKGKLSEKKRLIIAGRIAMIIIFANKVAIWIHSDSSDKPDSDITIDSLYNESYFREKNINNQEFDVTREDIEEVLSISGLFSSKGTNRLGFAHKTYAEFLAAWYVNHHQISLPQIMSLIVAPEDAERKLIPQLHQTCAWLSSMREDVLEKIIETDPDVVLKGDISDDNQLRKRIVDKLLKLYEEEKLFDSYFTNSFQSHKLNHPQLAEQLRPYIKDKNKSENVRREAINIARRCQIINLQNDLVQLILDKSESINLRVISAYSIHSIGDISLITDSQKQNLKSLVMGYLPEDKENQLKLYLLKILWNNNYKYLTTKELFEALTVNQKRYSFDSYWNFINEEIILSFDSKDLVIALNWLIKQGVRCSSSSNLFTDLANQILLKAWDNFDNPEIVKLFAEITLIQWNKYQDLITDNKNKNQFKQKLEDDDDKRRKLIEQFVLIVPESINDIGYIFGFFNVNDNVHEVSLEKDIFWMIEKIKKNKDESIQKIYIDLIEHNFHKSNPKNVAQINAIYSMYKDYQEANINSIFTEKFSIHFEAIDLDSEQGKKAKSFYYKYEEDKKKLQNITPLKLSPSERVLMCVEEIELGNITYWTSLCREISLLYNTSPYGHDFKLNLMELPGWKNADDSTKKRIIKSAKKYVLEKQDLNYDWIGTNQVDLLAIAGCKALYLLLNIEPDFVNQLLPSIWQKWASIIIATPNYDGNKEDQYLKLIYLVYSNAKTESIDTLVKLIDRENRGSEYIFIIDKFKNCWDEELKSVILKIIKDSQLKPKSLEILCQELIKHSCSEVIEFIKSLIKIFYRPTNQKEKDKILTATKLLINDVLSQYEDLESWELVWQIIQQDTQFGHEIVENLHYPSLGGFDLNLTETQLADFYIWLVQQYPYDEDPIHQGVYCVGVKDQVVSLRNHLLNQLRETKTIQGCQEIERIIGVFPKLSWLKQYLYDAQKNVRLNNWQPPTPKQLFQLIGDSRKRLVNDGNQLLDVLIESLQRLENELQGETPAVRDIWDKTKSKPLLWKPINENEFSDYVKRFLDRDLDLKQKGIIVNREVELRPSQGNAKGERTDIHVDAIIKSNGKIDNYITVIIEVKGCWHEELNEAMETQLVDRYLKDNTCKHGLYLIGWFNCPQWDNGDYRKKDAYRLNMTLEEAKAKFAQQAKDLSVSGVNVKAFVLNTALR